MKLVHGSLFSGFDAPSVAASWMGWKNAFHCEINPFCNEILKYWFPNSEHYEDITKTDFSQWKGRIDVLTGGFPCQPFSLAGQRKGADDNRYLWPHMLRAIREIRPAWVIGENVAGILTMVQPGKETEVGSQTSLFGEDNRKRILLRQEYVVVSNISFSVIFFRKERFGFPHFRSPCPAKTVVRIPSNSFHPITQSGSGIFVRIVTRSMCGQR